MKISLYGEQITMRFFLALVQLKADKKIRGVQTFARKYDINYWNLQTLKKEPSKRILKPEYIYYLVTDFGVSSDWLITGNGDFYSSKLE